MSIKVSHSINEDILFIKAEGEDESLQIVENYARKILQLSIENGFAKLLCDERNLVYRLSTFNTFQLAEAASKEAKNLKKIAIVCHPDFLKEGSFYETVAKNRGLNVVVTSDFEMAMYWLTNG